MDCLLGEIFLLPYKFAPLGFILCDGGLLNIRENSALFTLIGTKFGGNGTTNFALPDLRNSSPIPNMAYYIANSGIYPTYD